MPVVVSDTSPIRALAFLGQLELLQTPFGAVLIPPAVADELEHPPPELLAVAPLKFCRLSWIGGAEAIALALETGIMTILLDESSGRAVAQRLGLVPVGALGIPLRAKQRGDLAAIKPAIDRLRRETRFFVSEQLRAEVLRRAGE